MCLDVYQIRPATGAIADCPSRVATRGCDAFNGIVHGMMTSLQAGDEVDEFAHNLSHYHLYERVV